MATDAPAARPRPRGPVAPAVGLAATVDAFPASDGALYLLRGAAEDEFVIAHPTRFERRLVALLDGPGRTRAALRRALRGEDGDVDAALDQLLALGVAEERAVPTLGPYEADRYGRQLLYFADLARGPAGAEESQRRLARSCVLVLGVGGLGCWTASGLACAGVGELVLVDDDTVALSNLNRQILFSEADLGRPKVEAAAARLRAFDRHARIRTVRRRIDGPCALAALLDGVDLVVATADWPMYELSRWVNSACVEAGVSYVTAGQFPPRVRVGPYYVPGRTACLACQEAAIRREHPLYDELAAFRARRPSTAATLGPASGLVGSMLAMDAVHHLGGLADPASLGRALVVDLRTMAIETEAVARDAVCPVCGPLSPPA